MNAREPVPAEVALITMVEFECESDVRVLVVKTPLPGAVYVCTVVGVAVRANRTTRVDAGASKYADAVPMAMFVALAVAAEIVAVVAVRRWMSTAPTEACDAL